MTQNEFFNILMDELKELPELEIQKIILYYKEKFHDEFSSGKSEEDIIRDFGSPHSICFKYKNKINDFKISKNENNIFSDINLNKSSEDKKNVDYMVVSSFKKKTEEKYIEEKYINEEKSNNAHYSKSSPTVDKFLKLCIIIFGIIIFFPVITSIIGIIIGTFGIAFSIFIGSIGILIGGTFANFIEIPDLPQFIANFPYSVTVLFSLGSIALSIFIMFILYYSCKFSFRLCIKILNFLKFTGGLL